MMHSWREKQGHIQTIILEFLINVICSKSNEKEIPVLGLIHGNGEIAGKW